jgi:hypothetical protein
LEGFDQAELEKLTNLLREKFGNETFARFSGEGRAMTLEQVIGFSLEISDD